MPNFLRSFETAAFLRLRKRAASGIVERGAFWLFLVSVLLFLLRRLPHALGALFNVLLFFALSLFAVCALILLYRLVFTRLLWKVRNRLVVTYLLIGLAPVVLFVTLAGIAAYIFSGQFATYAASSEMNDELDRLSAENRAFAVHINHSLSDGIGLRELALPEPAEIFGMDPGPRDLQLQAWDNGRLLPVRGNKAVMLKPVAPRSGQPTVPGWVPTGFHGIVVDGGRLHLRALDTHSSGEHTVTVLSSVPLGPGSLDRLASGLGVVRIMPGFRLEEGGPGHAGQPNPTAQGVAHTPKELERDRENDPGSDPDKFSTFTGGVLPPPAFFLDTQVFFTAPLIVVDWQTGRRTEGLMNVTSRPALLYTRLFGTSVELGTIIRDALIAIGILFAVLELIALVMAIRLSHTITRSVADLYAATTQIDRGNFAHRITVTRRDQLAALSTSFNTMSESLERLLEQQREKDRMQSELAIAQEVQNNLFPHEEISVPSLELHGLCKPARTVSGDYYDFLLVGSSELCLAMGDISGKGISAALLMASLHSAVRAYRFAGEELGQETQAAGVDSSPFASPGKMLGLLNRHLYRSTQPEKYATLFLAHYSSESSRLTYSNGGQLPPIVLCANGSIKRLDCGGTVIGLLDGMEYEQASVTLSRGDILVAYSDGITEPENEFGEFGEGRLLEVIQRNRHLPLQAIANHTLQTLRAWIGDQEQPDDITLVLARQT